MSIKFGGSEISWAYDWNNILALARFLNVAMPFNRPIDVINFFEKPYYWTDQWKVYQEFKQSPAFEAFLEREHVPNEVLEELHRGK